MMRTPEEERIFHALSQIQTPAWDLSGVVEQAGSQRRSRLRPCRRMKAILFVWRLRSLNVA